MNQIEYIFEFLDFSDVIRLSHVCTQFNIIYKKYLTLRSNEWVIEYVDTYMRRGQIISAERLMRYYICLNDISGSRDNLRKRNKFAVDKMNITHNIISNKVISKYMSLICTYIWDNQMNKKYQIHRTEIYKSFRYRVHSNIDNYNIYIPINLYRGSIPDKVSDLLSPFGITSTNTRVEPQRIAQEGHTNNRVEPQRIDREGHTNTRVEPQGCAQRIAQEGHNNISNKDKLVHNPVICGIIKPICHDNTKSDQHIIASIFAYICILDQQLRLASDIVMIIKKNKYKKNNVVYYLVKWQLTHNNKYLKMFKHSDFAFGMYLYGYKVYKTDSNGIQKFVTILEHCLELDPVLIIALNSYIHLKSRIDLIMHNIESNPMYIPSYILSIRLLFDTTIWIRLSTSHYNILSKIDDFMTKNSDMFIQKDIDIKSTDTNLTNYFKEINEIKYSSVFINIHRLLHLNKTKNNNLIIENLILLYRLYIQNNRPVNESIDILLYIKNNYNITQTIKDYIYQQIQILT